MTLLRTLLTMAAPFSPTEVSGLPGPVTVTDRDGRATTMTADEFRRSRGASMCPKCCLWFSAATLRSHTCRYVNPFPPPPRPTGIDARVSTRTPARTVRALGDEEDD